MANKKEFNPEVAFWATRDGKFSRVQVNAAVYDILQKAEIGTSLLLVEVPQDVKDKIEANGKTAPTHKVVILPPGNAPAASPKVTTKKAAPKKTDDNDV